MKEMICFRGVPRSLAMDAWWLDSPNQVDGNPTPPRDSGHRHTSPTGKWDGQWGKLLVVAIVSIWFFWGQAVGLTLVLFAHLLFVLSCWSLRDQKAVLKAWGLLFLTSLPVMEYVQPLSVVILGLGFSSSLIWARRPKASALILFSGILSFVFHLPRQWVAQLSISRFATAFKTSETQGYRSRGSSLIHRFLSEWGVPVGGALVIGALILRANPLLLEMLGGAFDFSAWVPRLLFGAGIAFLSAPLLGHDIPIGSIALRTQSRTKLEFGINQRSVLRALILFNLITAVQTLTDISIVLLGPSLPSDMTLAEYAHRGAYPLLASASLAGGFSLAAHPHLRDHRLIRPFMILYVAQNAVLCFAALMRLELYVQEFGLTYLRIYSLIWMGFVAVGLCIILWQISVLKNRMWLIARVTLNAGLALYVASFVNFAGLIADYNLAQDTQDYGYICRLGPSAFRAVLISGQGKVIQHNPEREPLRIRLGDCQISRETPGTWQEWGFRKWRVAHILPSSLK